MAPPVVELGMHRSGTSAVARILRLLGVWMGSDETVSRRTENELTQAVNQDLLRHLGGHWSAPAAVAPSAYAEIRDPQLDERGRAALADLVGHEPFGWKDPRNCLTLPWWLARGVARPVVVIAYRHPIEVAASLDTRNQFGVAHCAALWEAYNHSLLAVANGLPAIVVPYQALTAAPGATIERLHAWLVAHGVPLTATLDAAIASVEQGRRHHVADALPPQAITPQQAELWDLLRTLPEASESFAAPAPPPAHAASIELLDHRRRLLATEAELFARKAQLRSRRVLARELARRALPGRHSIPTPKV